jgi:N6-L-threonylcarbamoyladenine synthase
VKILAIESSCDETAAAVIEYKKVISNSSLVTSKSTDNELQITNNEQFSPIILSNVVASQIEIHKKFGGVYPEIASRAHAEQIIPVIEEALRKSVISNSSLVTSKSTNNELRVTSYLDNIDLIAVTAGPGLIGSLLIGVSAAKTLAYANNKPIIGINHWLGHIYSCFSDNKNLPEFPLLALIVSGGHTGLVFMKSHTEIQTIGQTLDDAAGEAFDKVAKLLDLPYPGGPAISVEAEKFKNSKSEIRNKSQITNIKFPRAMLNRDGYDFSFSGLKTSVLNKVKELQAQKITLKQYQPLVAYEFQQCVIDILVGKTLKAAAKFKPKSICLCGGVSANYELREQLKVAIDNFNSMSLTSVSYHLPPMFLTGDNAAMIGLAAAYQITNGIKPTTYEKVEANSNLEL